MQNLDFRTEITGFFYRTFDIKGSVSFDIYDFDGVDVCVGTAYLGNDDGDIYLIFSIPNSSNDIYIFVTDGDPEILSGEVASLQRYNEHVNHLCFAHTIPTNNEYVMGIGWFGYLITRPGVAISGIPDSFQNRGQSYKIHLALPISSEDRDLKIRDGIDALMDKYFDEKRDSLSFKRKA